MVDDKQRYQDALDYIYSLDNYGKLGLERFSAICERLGRPQDKLRFVHVAGTNGKGSTTAMIGSILRSAGYRVGTYFSPYVYTIRERVQLDGRMIAEEDFARLIEVIRPHASALEQTEHGHPTEFEVKTALGLLYFAENDVDFAVLEVGLGGRLDATNIITPMVSVITNVTMDHMDRLGDTIQEIAYEKAGIIKQGRHCVTASADPEVVGVIRRIAEERDSKLWHVRSIDGDTPRFGIVPVMAGDETPTRYTGVRGFASGEPFSVEGVDRTYRDLRLRMQGEFQYLNASTAVAAIEVLQSQGVDVPESAIRSGIEEAYLPGRLEVLWRNPTLLIDGAHNLDGARKLADALERLFSYDRLFLVMGMVSGHVPDDVVGILAPMAHRFYATAADNERARPAESVAEVARRYTSDVQVVQPVEEAVRRAMMDADADDLVCVAGSFYILNEVPRQRGAFGPQTTDYSFDKGIGYVESRDQDRA